MDRLKKISNYYEYFYHLGNIKNDVIIIMAIKDALAAGSNISRFYHHSPSTFNVIKELGFETDLYGSWRHSYIGIMEYGNIVFEKIEKNENEGIYFKNEDYNVISEGYNAGNFCSIIIDTVQYARCETGLNIVVFDKRNSTLIDSVCINMLKENIILTRNEMQSHSLVDSAQLYNKLGIKTVFVFGASVHYVKNPSEWERFLASQKQTRGIVRKNPEKYYETCQLNEIFESIEEFKEHAKHPIQGMNYKNYKRNSYTSSPFLNVDYDGCHICSNQPTNFNNTVYIFGDSMGIVWELKDDNQCSTVLQNIINENNYHTRVKNYCVARVSIEQINNYIFDVDISPNDIIIIYVSNDKEKILKNAVRLKEIPYISLQDYIDRPHNYGEVFIDRIHPNHHMHKIMAEKVFEVIKDDLGAGLKTSANETDEIITSNDAQELREYIEYIKKFKKNIGSIVMNCNPFTNGHKYLIEYASKKCDWLYIFVVEEDRSFFPFKDRIELVRQGVKHLENVTVLPSGRFIISQYTFPEYFEKGELQDISIDPSMDINLFAQKVCPSLGINARFVGQEPFDRITLQYNETMKKILPNYKIEFYEIPRCSNNKGETISASLVRKLLETKQFDEISELVPESTLNYLKKFKIGK